MRFREIVFAACAAMPALAWAQGVIPTNNAAIFSAQPVQTPSGTTTGTLATRWGNRLDLVADFGADPTGNTDISTALSSAIATGRPVFIPAGTYLFSGSVTDAGAEPVNIECSGQATTTINMSGSIAISQTGNFTIPVSITNCGINFTGSGSISLAGTTYNNAQPLEGPLFQNDYFNVESTYTGTGPVFNFSYISTGNFIATNAIVNAYGSNILNNFVEISGTAESWNFLGNQWQDNISGSNLSNTSTGVFLNGSGTYGVQGINISNSNIVGFSKNIYIGPLCASISISHGNLSEAYYPVYISGSGITDVKIFDNYISSNTAASSGSAAIYVGAAQNIKIYHNTLTDHNTSGNYLLDLTTATNNSVTLFDNNIGSGINNNPNNVQIQNIISESPIVAPNVLSQQADYASSAQLTAQQSGEFVFFTGTSSGQTITLPSSTDFPSVGNNLGAGMFFLVNNGTVPVNIATVSTDYNQLVGGPNTLGGSIALQPGGAEFVYSDGGTPGWVSYAPTVFRNITSVGNTTINGIAVGVTPSVATLGTNPPVSGTAYQWAGPGTLQLACPITYSPTSTATASSTLDIGSTSTPSSAVDTESEPAAITAGMVHTSHAEVPAGWYYELTATNATIGTCVGVVH